jgi:ATP-dependent helicase/nuclease subunit A
MSKRFDIPDLLRRHQALASDPTRSAWVSANAGSGKTHVLTQRVLRLLLAGAKPAQILGLTFTKAAAANMAARIFDELSRWTSLDDEKLAERIVETGAGKPGPPALAFARQLFARTIETPGGLKIQTLHAFCERLLQLFPFEANVPAHFRVVDEREAAALMREARDRALAALKAFPEGEAALDRVARDAGAFAFDKLLVEAKDFAETLAAFHDAAHYREALNGRLGLPEGVTTESVEAEMLGGDVGRSHRRAWAQGLALGKANDKAFAAKLHAADACMDQAERVQALLAAFFTKDGEGEPRGGTKGQLTGAELRDRRPGLEADLQRELTRLIALRERRRAAGTLERSAALFMVAGAILKGFAAAKAERGALDFADQIARALALVTRSSAAWVMHKLDYGLDHLLIDEAQDNSAEQWRIVEKLTEEFFAGESARPHGRTVFAVGDEKQSIFSFQGAEPEKFAEMRRFFERRHREAAKPFASVPLNFSFRSAPAVLAAVDKTFGTEEAREGLAAGDEPPLAHEAIRTNLQGVVEVWPTVKAAKGPDPDDWRMPLDEPAAHDPAVILARRIADQTARWLKPESRERVIDKDSGSPRPIRPGDVMILVRRRNAFFEAMIRALKDKGVKVAGADRLKLNQHIAVMDLIAAGRASLTPDDDLTLACLLKSPLIGLDDNMLYALAGDRTGSLAGALAASDEDQAQKFAGRVAEWRARAARFGPYAFYARLLGEEGGRKALIARLGDDASDPIDEFLALALAHERSEAPSLTRFLAEVEADEAEIKRDLEAESEGVRVLTVHASKGLEAPIVFLPDTTVAPGGEHDPKLLPLIAPVGPLLFAWSRKKSEDCEAVAAARGERRKAEAGEHRRLLYVAMTRAAERLIVAGYETQKGRKNGCWYDLVAEGLKDAAIEAPAFWDEGAAVRRYGEGLAADGSAEQPAVADQPPPAWLSALVEPEAAPALLRPSAAVAAQDGAAGRRLEGLVAHALLNLLPAVDAERRAEAARAYLDAHGAALSKGTRDVIARQAIATVEAPELAPLFGAGSRGEVSFVGGLERPGGAGLPLSGRLDRLAVTDDAILIADFKLGGAPERPVGAHVAQLALYRAALAPLYPSRRVSASLVYLDGPEVRPLSDRDLDAALDGLVTL